MAYVRKREGVIDHYAGMTWPEIGVFDVLCIVANRVREPRDVAELSARELARIFACSRKTVLRALRGLEGRRYIEPHPKGWRVLNLNGTAPQEHDDRFYRGRPGDRNLLPESRASEGGTEGGPPTGPSGVAEVAPAGGQPRPREGATPGPPDTPQVAPGGGHRHIATDAGEGVNPSGNGGDVGKEGDGAGVVDKKPPAKKRKAPKPSPVIVGEKGGKLRYEAREGRREDYVEWKKRFVERWLEHFDQQRISDEIRLSLIWCRDNPDKATAVKNFDRFLSTWFREELRRDLEKQRKREEAG